MMVFTNAEDKTFGTRGEQETGQRVSDPYRAQGTRPPGRTARHQPIGAGRANGQTSTAERPGGIVTGGILDQLIDDTRKQLSQTAEHLQRLEALREQLNKGSGK